jgi:hypothetical protein
LDTTALWLLAARSVQPAGRLPDRRQHQPQRQPDCGDEDQRGVAGPRLRRERRQIAPLSCRARGCGAARRARELASRWHFPYW